MTTSDPLDELLPCISCGVQGDEADGFGTCTCGNEKLREQILAWHLQKCRSYLPDKKTQEDVPAPDHISSTIPIAKAKGWNDCIDIITKRIEGDR